MIAHRLTTIKCAQNLLFFESPSKIVAARKNSDKYEEILEKLKAISYAYGDAQSDESEEEEINSPEIPQRDENLLPAHPQTENLKNLVFPPLRKLNLQRKNVIHHFSPFNSRRSTNSALNLNSATLTATIETVKKDV